MPALKRITPPRFASNGPELILQLRPLAQLPPVHQASGGIRRRRLVSRALLRPPAPAVNGGIQPRILVNQAPPLPVRLANIGIRPRRPVSQAPPLPVLRARPGTARAQLV